MPEPEIASDQLYEFRKTLRKLKAYRGAGTQLVSVYVSADYPINEVSGRIREEINQAGNIKSKQTRNNVQDALERIVNVLKGFRKTPKNGLVIFSGNLSDDPSRTDMKTFYFEPINRLETNMYRCDSIFWLEPLEKMINNRDAYGIVVLDGSDATLAILQGTELRVVDKIHNLGHSKIKGGGQSANRYSRLIEEGKEYYHKKVGEAMDSLFLGKVKGVIVGGPGPIKEYFLKQNTFNYQLKVLGVVDTGYVDEHGAREVLAKAGDLIAGQEAVKEKKFFDEFMKTIIKSEKAVYGLSQTLDAIATKRASLVLVSEEAPFSVVHYKCPSCDTEESRTFEKDLSEKTITCPKCGSLMNQIDVAPIAEYIIEICRKAGIRVEVISVNTSEGQQFLNGFGGIGAILKY
jgi:peptide chain release factor subunit 1